jgi:hypothetical protein
MASRETEDADESIDQAQQARPEEVAVLNRAFEYALGELGLVDRADALTDIVAGKIIEVGATTITDPVEIARAAIKRLGLPSEPQGSRNQGT